MWKPSWKILLPRKDLPSAWLQVPPMQPWQQPACLQPPAGGPADPATATPADRRRLRADRNDGPKAHFSSNTWRGDVEEGPPCSDRMKRPWVWVLVKLCDVCNFLERGYMPHTDSKLNGSKKKSVPNYCLQNCPHPHFFLCRGQSVNVTGINHQEDLNIRARWG